MYTCVILLHLNGITDISVSTYIKRSNHPSLKSYSDWHSNCWYIGSVQCFPDNCRQYSMETVFCNMNKLTNNLCYISSSTRSSSFPGIEEESL